MHIECICSLRTNSSNEKRIVDLFLFAYPNTSNLAQILDCLNTSACYQKTTLTYLTDRVASWRGEQSWTFQPSWCCDPVDCRDRILGILVVRTVGNIREP